MDHVITIDEGDTLEIKFLKYPFSLRFNYMEFYKNALHGELEKIYMNSPVSVPMAPSVTYTTPMKLDMKLRTQDPDQIFQGSTMGAEIQGKIESDQASAFLKSQGKLMAEKFMAKNKKD